MICKPCVLPELLLIPQALAAGGGDLALLPLLLLQGSKTAAPQHIRVGPGSQMAENPKKHRRNGWQEKMRTSLRSREAERLGGGQFPNRGKVWTGGLMAVALSLQPFPNPCQNQGAQTFMGDGKASPRVCMSHLPTTQLEEGDCWILVSLHEDPFSLVRNLHSPL